MYEFIQHLINGLAAGTIYALVALGYTMVYGVLKLINFAHGDVMMVGVYVGYAVAFLLGREYLGTVPGVLLVFAVSLSACAAFGFLIERFAYRPLMRRDPAFALNPGNPHPEDVDALLAGGFVAPERLPACWQLQPCCSSSCCCLP